MGTYTGPRIVTDGLILDLDIANSKSFIDAQNTSLINTSTWAVGNTTVAPYNQNESVANENSRLIGTDPFGASNLVWGTYTVGDNNPDGGWNTDYFNIDRTKLYRFSVWVKRTSYTFSGNFYFGLYGNGPTFAVKRNDGGGNESNPYWDCVNVGTFAQNVWYLVTGHVYPAGTSSPVTHPDTGVYTISGGTTKVRNPNFCNIGGDVQWLTDTVSTAHRTYHYYSTSNATRMQFALPRIDMCDGNQPSLSDLLTKSPATIYDNSGRGNHHSLQGYYVPNSSAPRKFDFTGNVHWMSKAFGLSGVSTTCTVVIWYATTDTQELWARGNGNDSVYLSASTQNGDYYHSGVGTPTNYVDLKVTTNPASPINYRDGNYHMWEAKNVNLSAWTFFEWFGYPSGWGLTGKVSRIMVYNRNLSEDESARNYAALRGRFSI